MTVPAPQDTGPGGNRDLGVLGASGPLSFGHWRFVGHDLATAVGLVELAVELGMTLMDTADIYGFDRGSHFGEAEELLGSVYAERPDLREATILATKGGITPPRPYDSSPEYLRGALDHSLRRLQTDVIDLYQIHRPDMYTHPAQLAETLDAMVASGKVRAIGVSNFTIHQVEALAAHLDNPIVTNQPQFSVAHLDPLRDGTLDQCMRLGIVPMAWSPLAGGAVATGDGLRTELRVALDEISADHDVDRSTVALAFVLAHPSRPIALVGSQRPERLREAMSATQIELTRDDVYRLIQASEGVPLP